MRSRVGPVLLVLALATASCDSVVGLGGSVTRISRGTSFGECIGYCRTQLDVTPTQVTVTQLSWDPHSPPLVSNGPSSGQTWTELTGAFAGSGFQGLQATYGCPDCADGGAEWVEVEFDDGASKRVTFEYGHAPQALQPAVDELRRIFGSIFGEQPFGSLAPSTAAAGR